MNLLKKIGIGFFVLVVLGLIIEGGSEKQSGSSEILSSKRNIYVNYSAEKFDGTGLFVAKDGKTFLVITMNIENRGYDKFSANPYFFKIISNSVEYDMSAATLELHDKLDSVELLNGGVTKGSVAFEVPANIDNYQLSYRGLGSYQIVYKAM